MVFWGIEIKPDKPFSHRFDRTRGRLHISQATLGIGISQKKSLVQCNVGDKSPILLCCLIPDKSETCPLDFEFEEDDEVIFSVLGRRSVHLGGYFLDIGCNHDEDGDETDSYGEDIGETASEQSTDFETDDDFSDDDDIEMFPPSPRPNRGVVIEEILDDEKPSNGNGDRKSLEKKYLVSDSDGDNKKQIIVGGGSTIYESESEDEDGFPISPLSKSKDESAEVKEKPDKKVSKGGKKKAKNDSDQVMPISSQSTTKDESAELEERPNKKVSKKKAKDSGDQVTGAKRKSQGVQDGDTERGSEKPKKKKKKEQSKEGKTSRVGDDNTAQMEEAETNDFTQEEPLRDEADEKSSNHEGSEKPKKKKKKERTNKGKTPGVGDDKTAQMEEAKTIDVTQEEPVRDEADAKPSADKSEDTTEKKRKKNKNKKNKTPESDKSAITGEAKKESIVGTEEKKTEVKPTKERSYPNGLVVEELEMGKPDGRRASPGNKVSVHYIGKLKKNGKIFDSNIRGCNSPFQFRLGVGQVVKGWDVGVNGMRIGDKRRLTIPPSMGYGSSGAAPAIPPNAWLVFDVELVAVS